MQVDRPSSAQLQAWREEISSLCRQKFASRSNELPLGVEKRIRVLAFILKRYDALPEEITGQIDLGHDPDELLPPDVGAPASKGRYDWDRVRIAPTEQLPTPTFVDEFDSGMKAAADRLLMEDLEKRFGRELAEFRFVDIRGYQAPDAQFPPGHIPERLKTVHAPVLLRENWVTRVVCTIKYRIKSWLTPPDC